MLIQVCMCFAIYSNTYTFVFTLITVPPLFAPTTFQVTYVCMYVMYARNNSRNVPLRQRMPRNVRAPNNSCIAWIIYYIYMYVHKAFIFSNIHIKTYVYTYLFVCMELIIAAWRCHGALVYTDVH